MDFGIIKNKEKLILRGEKIEKDYWLLKAVNKDKLLAKMGLIQISFANQKEFDEVIEEFCRDYCLDKKNIVIENVPREFIKF